MMGAPTTADAVNLLVRAAELLQREASVLRTSYCAHGAWPPGSESVRAEHDEIRYVGAQLAMLAGQESLATPSPVPADRARLAASAKQAVGELARQGVLNSKSEELQQFLCAIIDRLASTAAQVPEGWQLVPKEPTQAMCAAAVVFANGNAVYRNVAAEALKIEEGIYSETYAAMLASAPAAPLQDGGLCAARPCEACRLLAQRFWASYERSEQHG